MTESTDIIHQINNSKSIPEAFFRIAEEQGSSIVYSQAYIGEGDSPERERDHVSRTYGSTKQRVVSVASYLKSLGVKKGDKVAIVSSSRPEWMEADIAILALGAISVSVYQSLPADDIGYILYDAGVDVVFVENREQLQKISSLTDSPVEIPETEDRAGATAQLRFMKIISFEKTEVDPSLAASYEEIVQHVPDQELFLEELTREDLASFVYTSGTTGPPKGVVQTHGNHLANVRQAWQADICRVDSNILLFLPLAHSFAKLMGYLGFLTPTKLHFPSVFDKTSSKLNPDSVTKDIRESQTDIIPIVPRLLEKMASGVKKRAQSAGGIQGLLLKLTLWSAKEVHDANERGRAPTFFAQMAYDGTDIIRKKIKKQLFGDSFRYAVSGGAKLNPKTAYFFEALGIEVLQGYGLTETCVATNVNRSGKNKIGTVGPVLADDIELKIAEDQEILFRGPNVALGYYKREKATRASWDEQGWFHTGDLGTVDDDGYLTIVGRKKEILVSSYGKNIAPEPIEAEIRSSPFISQALLIGDGRSYCSAIVTLDVQALESWMETQQITCEYKEYSTHESIRTHIWSELEKVNAELPRHEKIRKFLILSEEFTVENNLLTPTFKIKRKSVLAKYEREIEDLYEE